MQQEERVIVAMLELSYSIYDKSVWGGGIDYVHRWILD